MPRARRDRHAGGRRETERAQALLDRLEHGRYLADADVPHVAEAESLAGDRSERPGKYHAARRGFLPEIGVRHPLGKKDDGQGVGATGRVREDLEPEGLKARSHRRGDTMMARETGWEPFLVNDAQGFAEGDDLVDAGCG